MANFSKAFASCSRSFKIAILTLVVVLLIHIIGFSVSRWFSVNFAVNSVGNAAFHAGLWQHCACYQICVCFTSEDYPAWFKLVQGMETLALIGYICSLTISLSLMFYKQTKRNKQVNLFVVIASGAFGLTGVLIFAIKTIESFEEVTTFASTDVVEVVDGRLGYAFILCASASCLSLLLCVPLYSRDIFSHTQVPTQESSVHYSPQGQNQIYDPSQFDRQDGTQLVGNMPYYTSAESPPPYECQSDTSGIPYKS